MESAFFLHYATFLHPAVCYLQKIHCKERLVCEDT